MASWRYAFFFPTTGRPLKPDLAIRELIQSGLEIDSMIRLYVPIDAAGHLLDSGDEIPLSPPIDQDVQHRLAAGEQFSVHCSNQHLSLSCHFPTKAPNPSVWFGWSKSLFSGLPEAEQTAFME